MSLMTSVKHFLGLDHYNDYLWLESKTYDKPWLKDKEVNENCILLAKSKCNLFINKNVCISIDNEFEGIVIGKQNSTVRINNHFSGIISCNLIICGPKAKIEGELFTNRIVINEGIEFDASVTMGRLLYGIIPLKLSDFKGLSPTSFVKKYKDNLPNV